MKEIVKADKINNQKNVVKAAKLVISSFEGQNECEDRILLLK